jgi:leucyl aminopeptidase (aminopeptidase T)
MLKARLDISRARHKVGTMVDIAKQIVRTSLNLTDQDVLMINAWSHTRDLASKIAAEAFKVGADPHISYFDDAGWLAMFNADDRYLARKSPIGAALAETLTATVGLWGPEDPNVFARTKPEKMTKMEAGMKEIDERQRERKVRSVYVGLAQVTPQRARKYGVDFSKWRRIVNAALGADLRTMAARAQLVAKRLSGADEVRITCKGTDLSLSLRHREAVIEDGIVDANDVARGHLHTSLPTGFVDVAPVETAGDGRITFPSTPLWGKMVRDLTLTFSGGRVIDFRAAKNGETFGRFFKAAEEGKESIGSVSVGVNPRASYLGGFVDHLVAGAVSVGIGENLDIGGSNKAQFEFGSTLPRATLVAGGIPVVEAGALAK